MWANITLVVAAIYYFAYNVIVCLDGYRYYNTSTLYFQGDAWYLVNSVCYLLCSLRDWDVFWFMPTGGQFPNYNLLASEYVRARDMLEAQSVDVYRDSCLQGLTGELDGGRSSSITHAKSGSSDASGLLGSSAMLAYSVDGVESSFDTDVEMGDRARFYTNGSSSSSQSSTNMGNITSRIRSVSDAHRTDGQECSDDEDDDWMADIAPLLQRKAAKGS
jgi:hypothetical protein